MLTLKTKINNRKKNIAIILKSSSLRIFQKDKTKQSTISNIQIFQILDNRKAFSKP